MIHLIGPVVLAAALAGTGMYGLLARRSAVLVLIGAELVLNAANVLLVTANALPAGGLAALSEGSTAGGEPMLPGQVMAIFVITIAAAEIGLALALVLLLYRRRRTSDLGDARELGEASASYTVPGGAGEWPVDFTVALGSAGGAAAGAAAGNSTARAGGNGSSGGNDRAARATDGAAGQQAGNALQQRSEVSP